MSSTGDKGSHRLPMQAPLRNEQSIAKETPVFMEPFVGWRVWGVLQRADKWLLQSVSWKVLWEPEEPLVATCMNTRVEVEPHITPNRSHNCGIYSVNNKDDALRWLDSAVMQNRVPAYGTVKLWGSVFRYTKGFLAQYAYPQEIWVSHALPESIANLYSSQEIAKSLRQTYRGVEVRTM